MSDKPTAYFQRIIAMYMDIGTETVLQVLQHYVSRKNVPQQTVTEYLASHEIKTKLSALHKDNILNKAEYNLVTSSIPSPDKFDIALLVKLLINLFGDQLPPPHLGWNRRLQPLDESLGADLLRIRDTRNKLAHRPNARLSKEDFERMWIKIEAILLRIIKQVEPDSCSAMESNLRKYKDAPLESLDKTIRTCLDKFTAWKKDITKLQQQVDDLQKSTQEFHLYFKKPPERYCRYIKLLFEGGSLVMCAIIQRELNKTNSELKLVLHGKREEMLMAVENKTLQDQLFPPSNCSCDPSKWDIWLLANTILILYGCTVSQAEKESIQLIKDARENYADYAISSLDIDLYISNWTNLTNCLIKLSQNVDGETARQVEDLIEKYKKKVQDEDTAEAYIHILSSNGVCVRTLAEIYYENMNKLHHLVGEMAANGKKMNKDHVLEVKLETNCENDDNKIAAEESLRKVCEEYFEGVDTSHELEPIRIETNNLLRNISEIPDVEITGFTNKCVLIEIRCKSFNGLQGFISYVLSRKFKDRVQGMTNELCHMYDEVVAVFGNVTLESIHEVLDDPRNVRDNEYASGISFPITCSTAEGMRQVLSLLNDENTTNSLNQIADQLSIQVNETVTLKAYPVLDEFSAVFCERGSESSGSGNLSNDDEDRCSSVENKFEEEDHVSETDNTTLTDQKPFLTEMRIRSFDDGSSFDTLPKTTQHEEPSGHSKGARYVHNYTIDPKSGRALSTSVQVIHYTAHLKSWPRVFKFQQSIKGLVSRSSHLENILGHTGQQDNTTNELFQIDIYMHSSVIQSPDSFLVRGNAITEIKRLNIELSETITDPKQDLLGKQFRGLFVDTNGVKLVETISNTKIIVRCLPESQTPIKEFEPKQSTNFDTMKVQISNLLEWIVFEKLHLKCKILNELRMSTNTKFYTAIDGQDNDNYVSNFGEKKNKYKDKVDNLLGEMIALFKRSKLPKNLHPVIEGYAKKRVSEEVRKDLFKLDEKICGCGYRYSTFNVNIVKSADKKERKDRIKNFLKKHEINDVKFNFVSPTISRYVGSKVLISRDKQRKALLSATLGAYASFTIKGKTYPCGLIPKHFAFGALGGKLLGYAKQDETLIEIGHILQETVHAGGYDIAAATLHENYMKQCDVRFKNSDNEPKSGIIYTSDLDIDLQDQRVYLWGAESKPGLGIIRIPELIYPDTTETYMLVEDMDALGDEPVPQMAVEGDSGAILCLEDFDDEHIYVLSMLIGTLQKPSDGDDDDNAPDASSSLGNENAPSEISTNVVANCDPADSETILNNKETDKNENSIAESCIDIHQNSPLKSNADDVNPESACSNSGDTGTFRGKNGTGDKRNVPAKRQYIAFLVNKGVEQLQNVTNCVFELKGIAEENDLKNL